jgi:hypothetical protein
LGGKVKGTPKKAFSGTKTLLSKYLVLENHKLRGHVTSSLHTLNCYLATSPR